MDLADIVLKYATERLDAAATTTESTKGGKRAGRATAQEGDEGNMDKIAEVRPEFCFTSVQVNKNYASALHVDKNNCGPSLIVGLGDYSGGG